MLFFFAKAFSSFFSGIFSSMGLGAGPVLIFYLIFFENFTQKDAQGVNLIFSIPIAVLSIFLYLKNGFIQKKDLKICLKMSAIGLIGCIFGFIFINYVNTIFYKKLFALFMLYIGLKTIFFKKTKD